MLLAIKTGNHPHTRREYVFSRLDKTGTRVWARWHCSAMSWTPKRSAATTFTEVEARSLAQKYQARQPEIARG